VGTLSVVPTLDASGTLSVASGHLLNCRDTPSVVSFRHGFAGKRLVTLGACVRAAPLSAGAGRGCDLEFIWGL